MMRGKHGFMRPSLGFIHRATGDDEICTFYGTWNTCSHTQSMIWYTC